MKTEMRKTGIDRFGPEKRTSDARGIVWAMAAGTSVETEVRGRRGARGADGRGGNPGFGGHSRGGTSPLGSDGGHSGGKISPE